jgi:EmbC-like arabinotransferase in arabinogalactan biosynthesis
VCGLVLAGQNMWPFVSGWYTPTFSTVPPLVGTVPVATIVLAVGGVVVALLLARSVWQQSAYRDAELVYRNARLAPGAPVAVVLVAVLALQVLSLARIAVQQHGYTPAADALATAQGDPCGLQSVLQVETDPAAGVLAVGAQPAAAPATRPTTVDAGGTALPGVTVAGAGQSSWFTLDDRQRAGALPVVVTVSGVPRAGDLLDAEFARGTEVLAMLPLTGPGLAPDGAPTDRRLIAPAGADSVRLTMAAAADGTAAASLPRAPVLTPMTQMLPRGTHAILDWPVAFVFPCLTPEPLPPGTAGLAQWRVAPPADDPSAAITYTPGLGGPFAGPRLLVTQRRMPTYLRDDPTRDGVQLYRWEPVEPLRTLTPTVRVRDAGDLPDPGHLRVPQLIENS